MATSFHAVADIGVAGLAVMGSNLARNLAHHGYAVALYNRTAARTAEVVAAHGSEGTFVPADDLPGFVASLKRPRRVIIMVQAGAATDAVIDALVALMEPGDIIVDGGNSNYQDTIRREQAVRPTGIHFVGSGISGGEEGALTGPAIMPGGTAEAYAALGPILEDISAHVGGVPCCTHIGPDGAGHFVKMVHNGIEYADMQLIGEAYDLLRHGLGAAPAELAEVFAEWNRGPLESYLIEITAEVLAQRDAATGRPFVDIVVDASGQKGTGRWTVQSALDLGVPVTGIAEATFARALSSAPVQRAAARATFGTDVTPWAVADPAAFTEQVRQALYAAKIAAYSQGFDQIAAASALYGWGIRRGDLARIWRGGCIIRAVFLDHVTAAYERDPGLPLLIADPEFAAAIRAALPAWREVVAQAALHGLPVPALASSLAYFDGLRQARSAAALIQGQRDLFGAHTYKRVDAEGVYHTLWSGDHSEVRVS